jgi:hypothetical protein
MAAWNIGFEEEGFGEEGFREECRTMKVLARSHPAIQL